LNKADTCRIGPLVFGADAIIAEFVRQRLKNAPDSFGPCTAIGVIRSEKLAGGVVYFDYDPKIPACQVAFAFDDPRWATKHVLRSVCNYPFLQLGCLRVSAVIARKNKRSRKMVERIGFKLEGVIRKGFVTEDAMLYGLLRPECRFLEENNG